MLYDIPATVRAKFRQDIIRLRFMVDAGICQKSIGWNLVFWPPLVELNDCVVVAGRMCSATVPDWLRECEGDLRAVEANLNWLPLWSLFYDVPNRDELDWMARFIRKSWLTKLKREFPDRRFIVERRYDDGGKVEEMTFYQGVAPSVVR